MDAGIAESFANSGTNVTGISNMMPAEPQLENLMKVLPAVQTIGIIYNTAEANSLLQVQRMVAAAKANGISIQEVGITSLNEVSVLLPTALESIDALYAPTDNTVASAYPVIMEMASAQNVPVFCAEPAGVQAGALMSTGLDYYTLGKETALMAVQLLEGKTPQELPIGTISEPQLVINSAAAELLGIAFPAEILALAKEATQ